MTANVTFVLEQVADAIKIPNAALRFKPTRDQMQAICEASSAAARGSAVASRLRLGHRRRWLRRGRLGGRRRRPRRHGPAAASGADGKPGDYGDKKPVWKLVDGKPKMVLIKPGLTDGWRPQMVEGDLQAGDQLITECQVPDDRQRRRRSDRSRRRLAPSHAHDGAR